MEVFVARYPIFDKGKNVSTYELTFRAGFESYYYALQEDSDAVDLMAFVNFAERTDGKRGLVQFTRDLLIKGFWALLPADSLIVDLPGDLKPEDEVVTTCKEMKQAGYMLAVDYLTPFEEHDGELLALADMARVDFITMPAERRKTVLRELEAENVQAVAKSLETLEIFEEAQELGYEYYQGEFFSQPVARPDKSVAGNKLAYLRVLDQVNRSELSYDDIEALVKLDVTMTVKLLQFMNSAWYGLKYKVNSIRHALVLLGPKEVKQWMSVLVLKNIGDDKPSELLLRSLIRAKVAEQMAPLAGMSSQASELFLMGMLSVIDALTDMNMTQALAELPISDDIRASLVDGTGRYGDLCGALLAYERGDWDAFAARAASARLDEDAMPAIFAAASKWAGEALSAL